MLTAEKLLNKEEKLAVVGLGYVGLPLAVAFAEKVLVIGFDINKEKIQRYRSGVDPTNEVGSKALECSTVEFTDDETSLKQAGFLIVAVPTPVDKNNIPDLSPLKDACRVVGRNLRRGTVVMFESTVYPGTTEDICVPILEETSGLSCGVDFYVGYSPERINPGDCVHRLDNIPKIVSGMDRTTAVLAASVYEIVVKAGIHIVSSIKVAETAKLAENVQRDVNIAFMNELAVTLDRMNIRTADVLGAMNTKWNALGFRPGLVGGHCISVDPYYLIQKAQEVHGRSQLVQISRKTNSKMGFFTADVIIRQLIKAGHLVKGAKVYIMGVSYKENCPDLRNTMIPDIIIRLQEYGVNVFVSDPVVDKDEVFCSLGIHLVDVKNIRDADCMVFAVAHRTFKSLSPEVLAGMFRDIEETPKVLIDLNSIFSEEELRKEEFLYWSL
ncbi:nucleotide sugar dehydrogenase [Oscillospiraceae bacterium LTW-04]|nr:nucleotide sugar dehydrogenase [Oscillospiraceae bacterium MB24-C1]